MSSGPDPVLPDPSSAFAVCLGSLLSPEDGPVVRVDAHEWSLVEYRSTGRLRTRTMRVGGAEYTAQVPETSPHRLGSAPTLEALAAELATPAVEQEDDWAQYYREQAQVAAERTTRDRGLAQAVTEVVTRRVLDAAASAPPASPQERRECRNCRGQGGSSHACSCKERGVHYLGVLSGPADLVTDEPTIPENLARPDQGFDPDCPACQGAGVRWWTCPVCAGVGQEPACLDWLVTGPDGALTLRRDVAGMLRDGDVRLHVHLESINRHARVTLRIDGRVLAKRVNAAVAEGQPTWVRRGCHFQDWSYDVATSFQIELTPLGSNPPTEMHGHSPLTGLDGPFSYTTVSHDPRTGKLARGPWVPLESIADIVPAGEVLLGQLQQQASGNPWMGGEDIPADSSLRGADGLVERVPFSAVVKLPLSVLLDDAISQAAQAGYALGLSYGFIATGQHGPAVYLLADDDRAISEIGSDYDWHGAIAEAHARLPKLLARLADLKEDGS